MAQPFLTPMSVDPLVESLTAANRALVQEVGRARHMADCYRYHYSSHMLFWKETQELKRELSDLKQENSDLRDHTIHLSNKITELEALERVADLIKEEKPLVGVEELAAGLRLMILNLYGEEDIEVLKEQLDRFKKSVNPNTPMRAQQQQEYVSILSTSPGYVGIQKELEEAYEMEKQKREKMKNLQRMVDDFIIEQKVQFPLFETKQGPSI